MFSGFNITKTKNRALRFWSIALSAVLAITLLQVAPPARAVDSNPLSVNLVTRFDDEDIPAAILIESSLVGTSSTTEYRLDLDIRSGCGVFENIDNTGISGIRSPSGAPIDWAATSDYFSFVGLPSNLELVLDNLRIVREIGQFGPSDCGVSSITSYLMDISGTFPEAPQGSAHYFIAATDPFPLMTDYQSNDPHTSPRLNTYSDGFEVEWDEYVGAAGFTPAGFAVRYRTFDGNARGPWIYVSTQDGTYRSLFIRDLVDASVNYEFQVAPTVQNCENQTLYGRFTFIPNYGPAQLGDPSTATSVVGLNEQLTGGSVASQCSNSPQAPVITTSSTLELASINFSYSQFIAANGNNLTYAITGDNPLPTGLALDSSTGEIFGTPARLGLFTFNVTVTDSVTNLSDTQEFTLAINDVVSVPIDVNKGGATWQSVGSGISSVRLDQSESPFEGDSMKVFWLDDLMVEPIEIGCPENFGTRKEEPNFTGLKCDVNELPNGLIASIGHIFTNSDPWHQLEVALNNIGTEERSGYVKYVIDLSADASTEIEMTSDGDLQIEDSDSWFVTSGGNSSNVASTLHYFGSDLNQTVVQGSGSDKDKISILRPVTLPAGNESAIRFVDGVVDFAPTAQGDAVVTAIKAADQLENSTFQAHSGDGQIDRANVLNVSLQAIAEIGATLPNLHTVYECNDFGKQALYPVIVQNDGMPIGCDLGVSNFASPGEGPPNTDLSWGLAPGGLNEFGYPESWITTFQSTFPNAAPRYGWACNTCAITSEGPVVIGDSEIPNGIPLGFSVNRFGSDPMDSIRILPNGVVQLHSSSAGQDLTNGQVISVFGNLAMGNEVLQGEWHERPDFDFFYWGRTLYQGRVAFVVTWVKIPTYDYNSGPSSSPISGLEPTTVQLMLVSDQNVDDFEFYVENPEDRTTSNLDLIWNYKNIQSSGAVSPFETPAYLPRYASGPLFAGEVEYPSNVSPLISDAFINSDVETFDSSDRPIGMGQNALSPDMDCDQDCVNGMLATNPDLGDSCDADCVATNLLTSRLQSPVNGRYVLGFRKYEFTSGGSLPPGFPAPAAPRNVELTRTAGDEATLTWSAPTPWVLRSLMFSPDTQPIYGYRLEIVSNSRNTSEQSCNDEGFPGCKQIYPALTDPPLTVGDAGVSTTGSGDEERISIVIPGLRASEQYQFRVYATYSGIDFPLVLDDNNVPIENDILFVDEVRSVPAYSTEVYVSDLDIEPIANQIGEDNISAQILAEAISGNGVSISNATINGSEYVQGLTSKSVGIFSGGQNSLGFSEGIVLAPLVDVRTFQRGSGITNTESMQYSLNSFSNPNDRQRYTSVQNQFNNYLSSQESWDPESGVSGAFDSVCDDNTCANGTTYLQFDVSPTDDFVKFEYVLAGTEPEYTGELYDYPDGFGLFIDGIDQESSCALIPQVENETIEERFVSMGNARNARLAELVGFDSDLHAQSVTSILTCQADVAAARAASETVTITMVIANARDGVLSPAVFVKANSIRFEETSIDLIDVPRAFQYEFYEGNTFTSTGAAVARWDATGLPNGLTMNPQGYIEGTPSEFGSFSFTVVAYGDNDQPLASQTFSIVVEASLMGPDQFLQGNFVEVGIGGNGHFGSAGSAPDGFNPRDPGNEGGPGGSNLGGRIGFVSDRDRDGWGNGKDDGDFFVPGTPFEGFGVDVGGTSYFNNHEDTDIARQSEVLELVSSSQRSTWTSMVMENGLQLRQVSAVPINDQRLDVTVTLTNTSDTALEDVYYARQVDNDANVFACTENGGGWKSLNTVEAQANTSDGLSLVSSIMMDDCNDESAPSDISDPHSYLGMISTDPYSVAALQFGGGGNGFGAQKAVDFVNGFSAENCNLDNDENCLNVDVTPGAQVFGDSGIGLGFELGTIDSGDSKTVTFSYILSPEAAQEIIDNYNRENNLTAPSISLGRSNLAALVNSTFDIGDPGWIANSGGAASFFTMSPQLPTGMSFNITTGEISGTPTVTSGITRYTLTANNLAGSSSVEFLLAVVDEPYLYNDDGLLKASWPSDSPASVPRFEYQVSETSLPWLDDMDPENVVSVENTSATIMNVPLMVEFGFSYKFRVRQINGSGESLAWVESQPFFFGLSNCTRSDAQLKILLLSSPLEDGTAGTNPSTSDASIRNAACQSSLVSVEVFDGKGYGQEAVKGSGDVWQNELENVDVVILPKLTSGNLFGSDLMSDDAADELSDWVHQGGRLIITGSGGYTSEINDLLELEPNSIEAVGVSEVEGVRRQNGANTSLPLNLPTFDQPGIDVYGINANYYVDNYGETASWNSASLATTFSVSHGSIVALSNNFATTNRNWDIVLRQAIHSTINQNIVVNENETYWYVSRGELYSSSVESDGGSIVRLGSAQSPNTISCLNTPLKPAVITRSYLGTTLVCGSVLVDDGVVADPPSVRLTRFFAANTPWVKTSVEIYNNDENNTYENSVWFGGDLGLGDSSLLEYQGSQVSEFDENAYRSQVIIASQGPGIRNSYEDGRGAMAVTINGQTPDRIFGGVVLDYDPAFSRNQLWSETALFVNPGESGTLSWFTSYLQFEPGCDRLASVNGWLNSTKFLTDSIDESRADLFEPNSSLRFPNLSNLDCAAYSEQVQNVEINANSDRVILEWDRPMNADSYEIEYREVGSNIWNHFEEFRSSEDDRDSYIIGGLEEGRTYEFRIRPINQNRTPAGDVAKGIWGTATEVYIAIAPSPSPSSSSGTPSPSASPSSSPSSSPSPSQTPIVTNSGPDLSATIVPQMIAQNGPGFPARLKKGKTVKFGMTAPSGLPLRVSSVGRCKTTAITKKVTVRVLVGKKIKKKKVKMQTGWAVKGTKKGVCTVTFSNSGDATRSPLAAAGTITVF